MEIREGFIVGLDEYCDRWCAMCELTSRCRSFAGMTAAPRREDPSLTAATIAFNDAPPIPPELASAMAALELRSVAVDRADARGDDLHRVHQRLLARVEGYAFHAAKTLPVVDAPPSLCAAARIVERYCLFTTGKIYRALIVISRSSGADWRDANGSAKAALVALERSHSAWLALTAATLVPPAAAEALLSDLVWLRLEIERVFPHARAFVRPGLDEPEAVARLLVRSSDPNRALPRSAAAIEPVRRREEIPSS